MKRIAIAVLFGLGLLALVMAGCQFLNPTEYQGTTNFDVLQADNVRVVVPTAQGTATPGVLIQQSGVNAPLEVQVAGTPVYRIDTSGNVSQPGGGANTGAFAITGDADEEQLVVTGYTTQTNSLFVLENSGNTDVFDVSNTGVIANDAGVVTFGDNVIVDGAADANQITVQGYTTQTNSLQVWEQSDGTDVGTISNAGALDVASSINFGADDLYPLGSGTDGLQLVSGTASATATTVVATGLTTPTIALCTITDGLTDNEEQLCSTTLSGGNLTLNIYKEDGSAADSAVNVDYIVIGNP